MTTKLKAPEGMTDVSFGGDNFKVGEDGIVEVPDEACLSLYQFGFSNLPEPAQPAAAASRPAGRGSRSAAADATAEDTSAPQ